MAESIDEIKARFEREVAEWAERNRIGSVAGRRAGRAGVLDTVRELFEEEWGVPCVAQFSPDGTSIVVQPALHLDVI